MANIFVLVSDRYLYARKNNEAKIPIQELTTNKSNIVEILGPDLDLFDVDSKIYDLVKSVSFLKIQNLADMYVIVYYP